MVVNFTCTSRADRGCPCIFNNNSVSQVNIITLSMHVRLMLTIIIVTQNGVAPVHSAVYLELDHMVELLITYGAQVNLKMKVGGVAANRE